MLERLKNRKGILLLVLVLSLILGACGSDEVEEEPAVKEEQEEDDGLRAELHKDEEALLEKSYEDLTDRERRLFDVLEKGDSLSDELKESIKSDVERLSKEKDEVLAKEEEEEKKAKEEYKKKQAERDKEREREEEERAKKKQAEDDKKAKELKALLTEELLAEGDSIDDLKLEDGSIRMKMSIDGNVGTEGGDLSDHMAAHAYTYISDELIEMNKESSFWKYLEIEFYKLNGEDIGTVRMRYDQVESNEYGSYFPPEKIDEQLGIY